MISTNRGPVILSLLVASFGVALSLLYYNFPSIAAEHREDFKYPRNLDDAKRLGRMLSHYKEENFPVVLTGVIVIYIMLQSFAIPGSLFLTILSGYLFPFPVALILVCTCSAAGAGICYVLSQQFGKAIVLKVGVFKMVIFFLCFRISLYVYKNGSRKWQSIATLLSIILFFYGLLRFFQTGSSTLPVLY